MWDWNRRRTITGLAAAAAGALLLGGPWLSPAGAATVTDMLGRPVSLPERPGRIVSLAPSLTETVFALGRGEALVGVTEACDYPAAARGVPSVGGLATPDLERIARLGPEVVLVTAEANPREVLAQLHRLKLPVFALKPEGAAGVLASLEAVGRALGVQGRAAALVEELRGRVEGVRARVAGRGRVRVLYLVWADPPIAASGGSFIHDLLDLAGGANVVPERTTAYLRLGWEEIVARRPEVILLTAHRGAGNGDGSAGPNRAPWARFTSIPAVRTGRVLALPSDTILRPGPRLADGLELLARSLHPAAFPGEPGR